MEFKVNLAQFIAYLAEYRVYLVDCGVLIDGLIVQIEKYSDLHRHTNRLPSPKLFMTELDAYLENAFREDSGSRVSLDE